MDFSSVINRICKTDYPPEVSLTGFKFIYASEGNCLTGDCGVCGSNECDCDCGGGTSSDCDCNCHDC